MLLEDADGSQVFQGYGFKSIMRFILDVGDVIANRTLPKTLEAMRPSLRQALVSTAIVEAVNQSLASGGVWSNVDDSA
jgi:hypothetical protein